MLKVHRDIILSNLSVLVEETDLNRLVPELIRRNVFNQLMISRILNPAFNLKRQKTDLYVEILKRGPQAFAQLQEALTSTKHLNLAEILREMNPHEPSQFHRSASLNSVGSDRSENLRDDEDSEKDGPCLSIRRKSSPGGARRPDALPQTFSPNPRGGRGSTRGSSSDKACLEISDPDFHRPRDRKDRIFQPPIYGIPIPNTDMGSGDKFYYACQSDLPVVVRSARGWMKRTVGKPDLYKMDSCPRGCALVINNREFDDKVEFPDRLGSENDRKRLVKMLKNFHFSVEVYENKTKAEMEEIVCRFSQKPELTEVDCCWVTIMSHGQEGDYSEDSEVVGVDGFGYKTSDIVSRFYNDSSRALIDKPKLFFFQACRGCLTDPGVPVGSLNSSGRITTDGRRVGPLQNVRIRTQSDIFIACPTPPGVMANRDVVTGAWFIQAVVDVFSQHAWDNHLDELIKMVDDKLKRMNNLYTSNFQALTTKTVGWNKHLFFYPGLCKDKATGNTVQVRSDGVHLCPSEGMDVVDATETDPEKSPNGTTYSRLKDDKDEDLEGACCFDISRCNTS